MTRWIRIVVALCLAAALGVAASTVGLRVQSLIDAGVLDAPVVTEPQPIDYAANAEVAQRAAEAGIVLLKNEGGVLPLAANARTIALIGGHADVGVLSGGGSSQVRSVGGAPVEVPVAREIVPAINRLAQALRAAGAADVAPDMDALGRMIDAWLA